MAKAAIRDSQAEHTRPSLQINLGKGCESLAGRVQGQLPPLNPQRDCSRGLSLLTGDTRLRFDQQSDHDLPARDSRLTVRQNTTKLPSRIGSIDSGRRTLGTVSRQGGDPARLAPDLASVTVGVAFQPSQGVWLVRRNFTIAGHRASARSQNSSPSKPPKLAAMDGVSF